MNSWFCKLWQTNSRFCINSVKCILSFANFVKWNLHIQNYVKWISGYWDRVKWISNEYLDCKLCHVNRFCKLREWILGFENYCQQISGVASCVKWILKVTLNMWCHVGYPLQTMSKYLISHNQRPYTGCPSQSVTKSLMADCVAMTGRIYIFQFCRWKSHSSSFFRLFKLEKWVDRTRALTKLVKRLFKKWSKYFQGSIFSKITTR